MNNMVERVQEKIDEVEKIILEATKYAIVSNGTAIALIFTTLSQTFLSGKEPPPTKISLWLFFFGVVFAGVTFVVSGLRALARAARIWHQMRTDMESEHRKNKETVEKLAKEIRDIELHHELERARRGMAESDRMLAQLPKKLSLHGSEQLWSIVMGSCLGFSFSFFIGGLFVLVLEVS